MAILILMLLLLFGIGWTDTATPNAAVVSPAVAVQPVTAAPQPLQVDGEPATALALDPATGEAPYAVAAGELYLAEGGGGWQTSGTSPNLETMVVDSRNPDRLWAGTGLECFRGGGVALSLMRSDDAGATWTEVGAGGLVPLASWDPGGIVIAHDCSGFQVSHDGGATWAMPEDLPLGSQITAFAVATSPESADGLSVLVGVTGEGGTSEMYRVDLSDPAAMTVEGPLQTWFGIASLAVEESGAILLGAPQGVLRSEDDGETWTTIRGGLESTTLERDPIEHFPTDLEPGSFGLPAIVTFGERVFVAGVDGVYQLDEAGQAWQKVADVEAEIDLLAVEPGTGALLVQTSGGEVLRIETMPAGA